jgi:hypothetical protein
MKKTLFILLFLPTIIFSQYRPNLLFREDFRETPPEIPVNQNHMNNPNLIINRYGPGEALIKKSNHDKPIDDPYYIWSGLCEGNWAIGLKFKDSKTFNLSKFGKIKWRTKQAGFRQLRLLIKNNEGRWFVSDKFVPNSKDWNITEIIISDINWMSLDINKVVELKKVSKIDLSLIEEIGFTDLMRGGGSNACSRIDWIEVYGFTKDL